MSEPFIACSVDSAFVGRHREALEAFVQGRWPTLPDEGVVLFDRSLRVRALAACSRQGSELVVSQALAAPEVAGALGRELRHRAALSPGTVTVRGLAQMLPLLVAAGFTDGCATPERVERVVAIHQPNYLPWCGYFAKVAAADVFVLLDDVPMPGGSSYVNRTRVAGNAEPQWLSVPTRHSLEAPLHEAVIAERNFGKKHVGTLRARYGRTPHFKALIQRLEPLFLEAGERLADFNVRCIEQLVDLLGLNRLLVRSQHLPTVSASGDRLVELVRRLGGTRYLSGKGGQNYQSESAFSAAGITLEVRAHQPIPYDQGRPTFEAGLSIVDALAHVGVEGTRPLLAKPPEPVSAS